MKKEASYEEVIQQIVRILDADGAFTEGNKEERAQQLLSQVTQEGRADFSPTRYGVTREEDGVQLLSVFEKGHNVYWDQLLEELPLPQQQMEQKSPYIPIIEEV
ncbi:hypothetical protein [Ammoniphilus sp. YIM 78166]|uniref:hypothetical protein n=1 Tax=Ammoniphilus sp. YIM 78166 TaxID=1644106 RepID=UPI00106F0F5B|nr:hypothetical protein [Ammoniphilus sp. YIM 78166]